MPVSPIVQRFLDMPLGGEEAKALAQNIRHGEVVPPELKKLSRRIAKKWTPLGKHLPAPGEAAAAERELKARNFDIEDAIESAGGARGSANRL
jgi:hypothetical protein